jgi:hypothetical protein
MNRRRLERLEWAHIMRLAAEAGRPYGFTAEEVIAEARLILDLPDDQQRAVLDALDAL